MQILSEHGKKKMPNKYNKLLIPEALETAK